jgi:hypothetical protein
MAARLTADEMAREELRAHGIGRAEKPLTTLYRIVKERSMAKKATAQHADLHAALPDLQTWLDRLKNLPWAQIWMLVQLILSTKQQAPKQAAGNVAGQPSGCESASQVGRAHLECIAAVAQCGCDCLDQCDEAEAEA